MWAGSIPSCRLPCANTLQLSPDHLCARCPSRPDAAALAAAAATLSGTTGSQLTALSAALAADPQARALLGAMPLLGGVQNEQVPLQQLQQLHAALLSLGQVHAQLMAQQVAGDPEGEGPGAVTTGGVGGACGGGGQVDGGTSGATPDPREEEEQEAATEEEEAEGKAGGGGSSKSRRSYKCSVCGQPKRWERVCVGCCARLLLHNCLMATCQSLPGRN